LFALSPAHASVIAVDDFSYLDGTLYGANGGSGWVSIWTGSGIEVASGWAQGDPVGNPPKYGSRTFDNPGTTGELFVAFDVRTPAAFASDDYFSVWLRAGVNLSNLGLGKWPGMDDFRVGNSGTVGSGITVQPNRVYRLVGAYDLDRSLLTLWIDPDADDFYYPNSDLGHSADASLLHATAFHMNRVDFLTNTAGGFAFDNFIVANTPEGAGLRSARPGDATGDGCVSGADYTNWADNFGAGPGATVAQGDFNLDGFVSGADYTVWADHFGQGCQMATVPEPSSWRWMLLGAALLAGWRAASRPSTPADYRSG
jgi:hypothetical protein